MARTVSKFAIAFVALALAAPAAAQQERVEQPAVVSLPAGAERLPAGRHPASISIGGKRLAADVVVDAAAPAGAPQAAATEPAPGAAAAEHAESASTAAPAAGLPSWVLIAIAAAAPLLLAAAAAWVYFRRIQPKKHMAPYRQALELLAASRYDQALPLLTEVEGRLPPALRRDARFLVAFASIQTGAADEAEHILTGLNREEPGDERSAYMLAWLRVREKKYEAAEPLLERLESAGRLDFQETKRLLGIVKYARANAAFREGRVDAAADLFEKVQQLGDFAAHVPTDLRNRHVVLGVRALFEKNVSAARAEFASLEAAAAGLPAEDRPRLLAKAKLGQALAGWVENDPESAPALDAALEEAARAFDPDAPVALPWPEQIPERTTSEKLREQDAAKEAPAAAKEARRGLRDIHFLRGMSVLRQWARMDGKAARDAAGEKYEAVRSRMACVLAQDGDFADVFLVVGLLMYYLHPPGAERVAGVRLLARARDLKMHEPYASEILHNRDKIEAASKDAAAKYMPVLDKYLNDETVRREVRAALLDRLSRKARFAALDKRPDLRLARSMPPTVEEIRNRSQILALRIGEILAGRAASQEAARIRELCAGLARENEALTSQAQAIEERESELLVATGFEIFSDERG